jgi:SnoaL-like domain
MQRYREEDEERFNNSRRSMTASSVAGAVLKPQLSARRRSTGEDSMSLAQPPAPAHGASDADAAALGDLLATHKLYENLALYCRGQDRKDLALMKSTFWPEATDNHGAFNGSAHEFCEWAYEGQKKTKHKSLHFITNVLTELDGDVARRESSVIYLRVHPDGGPNGLLFARYRDLCERREGEWKVLRRVLIHDHIAQLDHVELQATMLSDMPITGRWGDVYPNDPIHDDEW